MEPEARLAPLLDALEHDPSPDALEDVAEQLRAAEGEARARAALLREALRAVERKLGRAAREPRLRAV